MAARKKETKLVRTSVQLPQSVLERLCELGVERQSEALRLALERYFYISDLAYTWISPALQDDDAQALVVRAFEDFGPEDFRTAVRVMPELLEAYGAELPEYEKALHDFAKELREMNPIARMAVLDFAVRNRLMLDKNE